MEVDRPEMMFALSSLIKEGKLLKRPSLVVELVLGASGPETVNRDRTKGVFNFEHINNNFIHL